MPSTGRHLTEFPSTGKILGGDFWLISFTGMRIGLHCVAAFV